MTALLAIRDKYSRLLIQIKLLGVMSTEQKLHTGRKLWLSHQPQAYRVPSTRSAPHAAARVSRLPYLLESKSGSSVLLCVLLKASMQCDLLKWIFANQVQTCRGNKFHVCSFKHYSQFAKKLKIGSIRHVNRWNSGRKYENIAYLLL